MATLRIPSLRRFTKRLELRPLQLRDDRAWLASNCAMLPPKTPWELPRIPLGELTIHKFLAYLDQTKNEIASDERYTIGIFHKEVGTLLGYLYVQQISRAKPSHATLDFRLINIYWGNGFAKEAVTEALKLKSALKLDTLKLDAKATAKLKL